MRFFQFWIRTNVLSDRKFEKVAIKGENMEEYKHVADSNFKVKLYSLLFLVGKFLVNTVRLSHT